jgi:hypothetical protein
MAGQEGQDWTVDALIEETGITESPMIKKMRDALTGNCVSGVVLKQVSDSAVSAQRCRTGHPGLL